MKKSKMPVFKFSYRIEPDERQIIYTNICDISTPSRSFYFMVCISTIIATYGLLANSTAVVIGAMLVAPLMGPIFGIALGLSNGDNKLLRNSVRSELLGMLWPRRRNRPGLTARILQQRLYPPSPLHIIIAWPRFGRGLYHG